MNMQVHSSEKALAEGQDSRITEATKVDEITQAGAL